MKIRTKYVRFEEEIQGVKFVLQEVDLKSISVMSLKMDGAKVQVNALDILNEVMRQAVISWTGLENEDGQPLECTDVNKKLLPIEMKLAINELLNNRLVLSETEKKS